MSATIAPVRSTFRSAVVWTVVFQAISLVPGLLFVALQARLFGPELRGQTAIIVTAAYLAVALADLGYTAATPYQIGRRLVGYPALFGNFVVWSAASITIVAVLAWVLLGRFDIAGVSTVLLDHAGEILALIVVNQVFNLAKNEALGADDMPGYNLLSVVSQTVMPVALLLVWALAPQMVSVGLVVWCYSAGCAVASLAYLLHARSRLMPGVVDPSFDAAALRSQLTIGIKPFLSTIVQQLSSRIDLFVLALLTQDFVLVGVYSVALLLMQTFDMVPQWVSLTLVPRTAQGMADATKNSIHLAAAAGIVSIVGVMLLLIGSVVLPQALTLVFGDQFQMVYLLMLVMAAGTIFAAPAAVLSGNLVGKGYTVYHPLIGAAVLVSNATLMMALVPEIGIFGLAVTRAVVPILLLVLTVLAFCRVNDLPVHEYVRETVAFVAGVPLQLRHLAGGRGATRLSKKAAL